MSDPADNPYQSPRAIEAPNAEAGTNKQPFWLLCLTIVAAVVLRFVAFSIMYVAIVFVAALGIHHIGRAWTVLGFAVLGISPILFGVAGAIRKRLKRDKR